MLQNSTNPICVSINLCRRHVWVDLEEQIRSLQYLLGKRSTLSHYMKTEYKKSAVQLIRGEWDVYSRYL